MTTDGNALGRRPPMVVSLVKTLGPGFASVIADNNLRCKHCGELATHRVQFPGVRRAAVYGCEQYALAVAARAAVEG